MSPVIDLGYEPRPWQAEVQSQFQRFSVLVVHRRGGKTVLSILNLITAAIKCQKPMGRFGYVAPFLRQSRLIAWDYLKSYTRTMPGVVFNESLLSVTFLNGARIQLFGADNPDALRGQYFDGVVLDEVADMRRQTWGEIIRPALTDRRGWALFIGTPRGQNMFAEVYDRAVKSSDWFAGLYDCYHTDALPPEEIERAQREMGENEFRQEMLCDFQAATADTLISLETARAATTRTIAENVYHHEARVMGVDVARYGDDLSAIAKRQGPALMGIEIFAQLDCMELASQTAKEAMAWKPTVIFVDVGGLGAGVYDRLVQLGFACCPVDFGSRASDARFARKRTEIWWLMAEWLKTAQIPNDPKLVAELCAPTYSFANSRGKIELESKDQMRRRGLHSPDRGDALATTFAMPVAPGAQRGVIVSEFDPLADAR